jgi:acyl-CoA synthetase (NDP forming)
MNDSVLSRPLLKQDALARLLRPQSVAVVGASPTPGALGASVLNNLDRFGFAGEMHLINPNRSEINGIACLASARDLPLGVDCVVLAVPRAAVMQAMRDCATRDVGGVIIFAVGFAEEGPEGLAQQQEIAQIAQASGMVVLGPNCVGAVNYLDGTPLTFIETPVRQPGGKAVAIISQSGAIAAMLSVSLADRNVPLSFTVSTGNEAVSGVEDYLEYLIEDDATSVIMILAEHFRDPERLLALAHRAVVQAKPIVLLHPGRSVAARASAATHTGAMVGDYAVMRVMVEDAGVVVVESLAEALDVTEILSRCPHGFGGGTMFITESGAFKALTLDQCDELGVALPEISTSNAARLKAAIPEFIPATNPLDLTAQALIDPPIYERALAALLDDPAFNVVVFGIIITDEFTSGRKLPAIIQAIETMQPAKPVLVAGLDEGAVAPPALVSALRDLGVPFFSSAERVFRAIAALNRNAARHRTAPASHGDRLQMPQGVIAEYLAKDVLKTIGIAIPAGRLATTVEGAISAAAEIGFPVALKAQSAELSHKSDAGGVILNLANTEAVSDGWARLYDNLRNHDPDLRLDGVLVEAMGKRGTELIIGARRDPDWGLILLAGFGGITAEVLQDVRLLPPGLAEDAIITELRKLQAGAILDGFRGAPALDIAAIARIITRLDAFLQANPQIVEVDINPVVVYPNGEGAIALDALMLVRHGE